MKTQLLKRGSEGIEDLIKKNVGVKTALYGLGTETGRFLDDFGDQIQVAGLLDSFLVEGEMYGHPIISMDEAVEMGVRLIIIVARPGSCKAISKKIRKVCVDEGIALFDVRGKDMLLRSHISYNFKDLNGSTKKDLYSKIADADIISFDLFDTLVLRKLPSYTDVFEMVEIKLLEKGIHIPYFARLRLQAEKEISKHKAPNLIEIYDFVLKRLGGNFITAEELAQMEWEIDFSIMEQRLDVCNIFRRLISENKTVVITTDIYYTNEQIQEILDRFSLVGAERVFVSCEYGALKTQILFEILADRFPQKKILHIGDDELADIDYPAGLGMDTYRVFSSNDLFEALGGLGLEEHILTISDKLKVGMFISHIFNSPFMFEDEERRLSIKTAFEIGYLFCAPIITDFLLWLRERTIEEGYGTILFCARDGYLPGRLFKRIDPAANSIYFLSSRTAAVRAGMESEEDIAYVDSMKYFGTPEEALRERFGIETDDIEKIDRSAQILKKAGKQRKLYKKYIDMLEIEESNLAMFDFVAKGTSQMYLQKLFAGHMKGFYFMQLEPEFMADKGLDIEPFYTNEEKDGSVIFDNYYILETILTSPYPQIEEFGADGLPVFASENRSDRDLRCFERAQQGIEGYFNEILSILPPRALKENKKLDEKLLELLNYVSIEETGFLGIKVEDRFFGRMTDIKDVIA